MEGQAERDKGPGVGALLRASRLRCGEDLRDVAHMLRIRLSHLEAIEEGRFHDLPGPTYAIGFVRAYAEHLGLDSEEVIRRFKLETADIGATARLEFPVPVEERGIPGGAVLFVGVVLAALAYGGWYVSTTKDGYFAELISPLPERLASLMPKREPSTTTAPATPGDATGDQGSPASATAATPAGEPSSPTTGAADAASQPPAGEQAAVGSPPTPAPAPDDGMAAQGGRGDESAAAASSEAPAAAATPETIATATPETTAAAPEKTAPVPETEAAPVTPARGESAPSEPAGTAAVEAPAAPTPADAAAGTAETTAAADASRPVTVARVPAPIPKPPAPTPPAETAPATTPPVEAVPAPTPPPATVREAPLPSAPQVAAVPEAPRAMPKPPATSGRAGEVTGMQDEISRILVRAKSNSWIQVRDDKGNQLLITRMLRPGDVYRVPDRPGLTLMTGNAGALEILVDGEAVPSIGPPGAVRRGVVLDAERLRRGTAVVD